VADLGLHLWQVLEGAGSCEQSGDHWCHLPLSKLCILELLTELWFTNTYNCLIFCSCIRSMWQLPSQNSHLCTPHATDLVGTNRLHIVSCNFSLCSTRQIDVQQQASCAASAVTCTFRVSFVCICGSLCMRTLAGSLCYARTTLERHGDSQLQEPALYGRVTMSH